MFTAKIENVSGNMLTLTENESDFQVISITGLNPPNAQINTATLVGLDGAVFNSSKLETRNIVILIKINGDVENNRQLLYQYFRTKEWCKFYYLNSSRNVSIEGYVQNVECDLFTNAEMAQISIICPYPYFRSISEDTTDSTGVQPAFTFPFTINEGEPVIISTFIDHEAIYINNDSESESGVLIEIDVRSAFNSIELKNTRQGEDFELNYAFQLGDRIIINTNKGKKSVYLMRNGVKINLFSVMKLGSVFFQLQPGSNIIQYLIDGQSDNESAYIMFRHFTIYRGV